MSSTGSGKQRDREQTRSRLVDAVVTIIRERGFTDVGINSVAERAGVSKVLIYRYFGGLDGLLDEVADRIDPLQSRTARALIENLDPNASVAGVIRRIVMDLHMALKKDDLTKNLLVWELANKNALTDAFSAARERTGLGLTREFSERFGAEIRDPNAVLAILTAAVFYLTLRSDSVTDYNGIDISSEQGWRRIADAIADLVSK